MDYEEYYDENFEAEEYLSEIVSKIDKLRNKNEQSDEIKELKEEFKNFQFNEEEINFFQNQYNGEWEIYQKFADEIIESILNGKYNYRMLNEYLDRTAELWNKLPLK